MQVSIFLDTIPCMQLKKRIKAKVIRASIFYFVFKKRKKEKGKEGRKNETK